MARARNIKPKFFTNQELVELPFATRLLFIGLWTLADREGRLEDKPKTIKMQIFPADDLDVNAALSDLSRAGFLVRYKNSDGSFIQICKFSAHQSPHYSEKHSVIKPPSFPESTFDDGCDTLRQQPENSENHTTLKPCGQPPDSLNPDSLNPESRKELCRKPEKPAFQILGFHEFWTHYPRKSKRPAAEEQWSLLAPDPELRITILASLEDWKQSRQWSDENFIPSPDKWLKNRQWEDVVPRETTPMAKQDQAAAKWLEGPQPVIEQ